MLPKESDGIQRNSRGCLFKNTTGRTSKANFAPAQKNNMRRNMMKMNINHIILNINQQKNEKFNIINKLISFILM